MRFRQHRHTRDPAVRREVVQVDVQQRGVGGLYGLAERRLDMGELVEPFGADQVQDQMGAGEALAVALDKEVLAVGQRRIGAASESRIFRLGGA